jgi:hypothetical protein
MRDNAAFLLPPHPTAMNRFAHIRHKPPEQLAAPRELVVACAAMRSHVNLSHIVRSCGCFGIRRVIACGAARLHERIARDGADSVVLEVHRSLPRATRSSGSNRRPARSGCSRFGSSRGRRW